MTEHALSAEDTIRKEIINLKLTLGELEFQRELIIDRLKQLTESYQALKGKKEG